MSRLLLAIVIAAIAVAAFVPVASSFPSPPSAPKALRPSQYARIPSCSTQPTGWLGRQLRLQMLGLSGSMHLFWKEVSASEWLGVNTSNTRIQFIAWPYWLNGVVPLAYQTRNASLIAAVTAGVDYLLATQTPDGLLGAAINDTDPWPRPLLLYAFAQYIDCNPSYTSRVVPAMYAYLGYLHRQLLSSPPLSLDYFPWTYVRVSDMMLSVQWLYDRHPINDTTQQQLLAVNEELYRQSFQWKVYYRTTFPKNDSGGWNYEPHGVNNAMALKGAAVWWRHSGDDDDVLSSQDRLDTIWRYHGQASSMFSCDECVAGLHPSRGTELCAVVDAMWSLTTMYSILGLTRFADLAERITLNALPATQSADLWQHQYLQEANEVSSRHLDRWPWNSDGGDSNIYGLEPNFGCCTANFLAAWPKLIDSLYMYTTVDGVQGVLIAFLGPSVLLTSVASPSGPHSVRVEQETEYPFTALSRVNISATATQPFPLQVRIPGWMVNATVTTPDGVTHSVQAGQVFTFQHGGDGEHRLTLRGRGELAMERRYNGAATVSYGPLVFALSFPYNTSVLRRYPFGASDLQLLPVNASDWRFALQLDDARPLNESLVLRQHARPAMPFDPDAPPMTLEAYGRRIEWPEEMPGVAAAPPVSPVQSKAPLEPLTLIPYGSSMLRIAEIPTLAMASQQSTSNVAAVE